MLSSMDIYFEIEMKDDVVDFLLSQGYDDFYFFRCSRYSAGAFLLNTQEQVSARREFGMFRLFLEDDRTHELARRIKEQFLEPRLRIFVQPFREL